jgi:outer membrane protein assembly factor BamB
MSTRSWTIRAALLLGVGSLSASALAGDWLQWGGPSRDFRCQAEKLAEKWPDAGPPKAWEQDLGDGYSAVLAQGDTIYAMTRQESKEVLRALNAETGEPRWESTYEAPIPAGMDESFGIGPRGTPTIDGDRIFTIGIGAILSCFDKQTGELVWQTDLLTKFGATIPRWGYSSSPLVYQDLLIVPVGGSGQAVMAFDAKTGATRWGNIDGENGYSSPLIIRVGGQEQLVMLLAKRVVGLDPASGDEIWSHPHETSYDVNATTPCWGADNLLFISSAYGTGARVIELKREGAKTTAQELWADKKLGVHHGTVVRDGDIVYCSVGMMGPTFLAAADIRTGKVHWRERFPKATLVQAGDKLVALGEDGTLALLKPTAEKLEILSKVDFLTDKAWTVPTLVGNRLYARDLKSIVAVDLPK